MSDARGDRLREILEAHASGTLGLSEAEVALRASFELDLGFARLDLDRGARRGFPEVVYGAGKTVESRGGRSLVAGLPWFPDFLGLDARVPLFLDPFVLVPNPSHDA